MDPTKTSDAPDLAELKACLIAIAGACAVSGILVFLYYPEFPQRAVVRVLIVSLLCRQVFLGHNWARVLLGWFTVVATVILFFTAASSGEVRHTAGCKPV